MAARQDVQTGRPERRQRAISGDPSGRAAARRGGHRCDRACRAATTTSRSAGLDPDRSASAPRPEARDEEAVHAAPLAPIDRAGYAARRPASPPLPAPALPRPAPRPARGRAPPLSPDAPPLPPPAASRWQRPAARPAASSRAAAAISAACAAASGATSRGLLEKRHVRMAADGAGRGAGRVQQHGVEARRRRRPRRSRPPPPPRPTAAAAPGSPQTRCALRASRSTAVTRPPAAASCAVLPPGAAQRSATTLARPHAKQPRRQRRGGVLHPEAAFGEAGQLRHPRAGWKTQRAGGQHISALGRRGARGEASGRAAPRSGARAAIARTAPAHGPRARRSRARPACPAVPRPAPPAPPARPPPPAAARR